MKNLTDFDYLKALEAQNETTIPRDVFLVARVDGNNFHNFTKGLTRPFDKDFRETMALTTLETMEHFGFAVGYSQSDEASFIIEPRMNKTGTALVGHPRKGRVLKLATLISSYFSIKFIEKIPFEKKQKVYSGFDCRIYGGNRKTAIDSLRFRNIDCVSNAYQSVAQSLWGHKTLQNVSVQQIKQKLIDSDIDVWKDCGADAMSGVFFYKDKVKDENGRSKIIRDNGIKMSDMIKKDLLF